MHDNDRQYLFDKPRNVTLLFRVFYGACSVLLLLDFVLQRHVALPWERIPGFYGLFGFVACVTLVLAQAAQAPGRLLRCG